MLMRVFRGEDSIAGMSIPAEIAFPAFRLDGRTALVTGASSGIGAALAQGLAAAGARVVLAARRVERLDSLAARIADAGGEAHAVEMDVGDPAGIARAFEQAWSVAGPVQILVNNAGIAEPRKFLATPRESLDRVMQTNFFGAWDACQEAARRLVAAALPGSFINVASVLGLGVGPGYTSYSASKSALIALTRTLAIELVKHRIRVNAIAPGWFVTEMNADYFASDAGKAHVARMPPGRTGELQELIGPTLLLASEAGSYVNGVVLPIDGAHSVALI
jgi:NAD(P)-dependent dehydrogenase (short-subunit alcohol dehydrogenase family)